MAVVALLSLAVRTDLCPSVAQTDSRAVVALPFCASNGGDSGEERVDCDKDLICFRCEDWSMKDTCFIFDRIFVSLPASVVLLKTRTGNRAFFWFTNWFTG
jgi:hypothetical protein